MFGDQEIFEKLDLELNKKMNELEAPHSILRNMLAVKMKKS